MVPQPVVANPPLSRGVLRLTLPVPFPRPARWLCALACFILPLPAHGVLPPAAGDAWVEARTARFRVLSNAGEPEAVKVARHLERLADVIGATTTGLVVDGERETRVYVFRNRASITPYLPFPDDENSATAGFHVSGTDVELIAYFLSSGPPSMEFASHEYLHAVLSRSTGQLPVWANEGLAEFYSTFETHGRRALIGRAIPWHVGLLRSQGASIQELIRTPYQSPDYTGGPRRGMIYAQSWALVHMLVMGDKGPNRRFDQLVSALGRGARGSDALSALYGPNAPDSLEDALRRYVAQGTLSYTEWTFRDEFEAVPVRTRPLDRLESLGALGELLSRSREAALPQASDHLEAVWRSDSSRALPAALLCEAAERAGNRVLSDRWLAAVQRSADRDPRPQGIAGDVLVQRRLRSGDRFVWPAQGPRPDMLEARTLLRRALDGRPDTPEWQVPFGLTYLDDGPDSAGVQQGIFALMSAQASWSGRTDIAGGLAILSLRAGNRRASLFNYQRIPPGRDRAFWREVSGHLLGEATLREARDLATQGRFSDAESLVVGLRRGVSEAGISAACGEFLERMNRVRVAPARPGVPAPDR